MLTLGKDLQYAARLLRKTPAFTFVAIATLAQLYGVGAFDASTYLAIAALLTGTSVAATLVPARRAARLDPIVALRAD